MAEVLRYQGDAEASEHTIFAGTVEVEASIGSLVAQSDIDLLLDREQAVANQIIGAAGNPNADKAAFTSAVQ